MTEESYEVRLNRFLDEGWEGKGPRPSLLLAIGECALASVPGGILGTVASRALHSASLYRDLVIERARERYRAGFYADPFTKEPRLRADLNNHTGQG